MPIDNYNNYQISYLDKKLKRKKNHSLLKFSMH